MSLTPGCEQEEQAKFQRFLKVDYSYRKQLSRQVLAGSESPGVHPGSFSLHQAAAFYGNIDALHLLAADKWLMSVDVLSSLAGNTASSQSVVEQSISGETSQYLLAFLPSGLDTSWSAANLDALWALQTVLAELIFEDGFE